MIIRKDDKVRVLTGKDKGKEGIVIKAIPTDNKVIIEGINMVKKHISQSAAHPDGGIIEQEAAMDVSNVSLIDPEKNVPTRVGFEMKGDKKVRISKKSGKEI